MSNIKLVIKKKAKVAKSQPKKKRKTMTCQEDVGEITEKIKDLTIDDNTVFTFVHLHSLIEDRHRGRYEDGFYLISILFDVDYELKTAHKKKRYDKWTYGPNFLDVNIDALSMDNNNSIKYYNFCKEKDNILYTSTKKYSKYVIKFVYVKDMYQSEVHKLSKKWRTYFNHTKISEQHHIDGVLKHSQNSHIDNKINILSGDKVFSTIKTKVIFKEIQKNKLKLIRSKNN
jgi:hypothetical protein